MNKSDPDFVPSDDVECLQKMSLYWAGEYFKVLDLLRDADTNIEELEKKLKNSKPEFWNDK